MDPIVDWDCWKIDSPLREVAWVSTTESPVLSELLDLNELSVDSPSF